MMLAVGGAVDGAEVVVVGGGGGYGKKGWKEPGFQENFIYNRNWENKRERTESGGGGGKLPTATAENGKRSSCINYTANELIKQHSRWIMWGE